MQHTPVATSHGNSCAIYKTYIRNLPSYCPPPPHSPCPLTVKRVGQHEHTTPTVVVCCVHCTPLHTHQEYHSVCTHSPPPPGCRAVPRSKDQVLFLKPLHLGVGWLDPHAGCHWLGGCWAPWPVLTTTFTMQAVDSPALTGLLVAERKRSCSFGQRLESE